VTACRAPGKAVIWGEYAVLAGAPALVMAVNRFARVSIVPNGDGWRCRARGFEGRVTISAESLLTADPGGAGAAAPLIAAARALDLSHLPTGAEVELDTRAFYDKATGAKLGIGSSAAVCTAACAALATLAGREVTFADALAAHRCLQNTKGSGIDVAASFHGGLLHFQEGRASRTGWPANLDFRFVWTGVSASTPDRLSSFSAWRARSDGKLLAQLGDACSGLFERMDMERLGEYVSRLRALDREARLGIYTEPHQRLHKLAISNQVVYKPCGAGGGDIGVAFADNEHNETLEAFAEAARKLSFHPLSLEIAPHGIEPTR